MTDILKGDPSLIEFMLNPAKYAEGRLLAHNHYGPLITKRYDTVLDFDVNDSALISEQVPTSSGFFLWFITRSVLSVGRYSTIPSGAVSHGNLNSGSPTGFNMPIVFGGNPTLTWNSDTPVPYALNYIQPPSTISHPVASPRGQQITPSSLMGDFLDVRTIAGLASLRGDSFAAYADPNSSVGGATSTFNAFCAAGNFPNVWDILQTPHPGDEEDPIQCVDPADVSQYSFPAEDGMFNIPVSDGVCTLVGPDIRVNLQPSNPDDCDTYAPANAQVLYGDGALSPASTAAVTLAPMGSVIAWAAFVTPWTCTYSEVPIPSNPNNLTLQQIYFQGGMDPMGVIDTDVSVVLGGQLEPYVIYATCCHVFTACLPTGQLVYDTYFEDVPLSGYAISTNNFPKQIFIRPSRFHRGVTLGVQGTDPATTQPTIVPLDATPTGYMYVGTEIILKYVNPSTTDVAVVYGPPVINIAMRARSYYAPGSIGPARVLSYYGLSNGSSLHFRATVHAEGTPTGTVVPSARRGNGNGSYFSTREDLGKLARLFNRDGTPWHRCYNFRKYSVDGRMPPTPDQLEKYDRVGIRIPILLSEEEDLSAVNNDNKGALIRTSVALTNTDKMIQKLAGKRGRAAEEKQMYRPQEGALNPVTGLPEVTSATSWNPYTPPPMKRSREFIDALRPAGRPESWWSTPEGIAQQARDDQEDQAYPPVIKSQNPQPPQSVISAPYTYAPEASEWNPYK